MPVLSRLVLVSSGLSFLIISLATTVQGYVSGSHLRNSGDFHFDRESRVLQPSSLPVCAGLRGNGPRVWAHFTALAQVVEELGPIEGLVGASSGTISSWMYESMALNPRVETCSNRLFGSRECTEEERRARLAFMLKSFIGLPDTLFTLEEVIGNVLRDILEEAVRTGIPLRLIIPNQRTQAIEDLVAIFDSETSNVFDRAISVSLSIATLLNDEILQLLINSPDPQFHFNDLRENVVPSFQISGPLNVLRPGLLSFRGISILLDIVARFYAGYGATNLDDWERLLDECALPTRGLDYRAFEGISTSNGMNCQTFFQSKVFFDFVQNDVNFTEIASTDPDNLPNITAFLETFENRLTDVVGGKIPTLIATSVVRGNSAAVWETAITDYRNGDNVSFDVSWDDMSFGYFAGTPEIESEVKARFSDVKSQRFLQLGETRWFDALIRSPAEPILSAGVPITDGSISFGGWVDAVPAQAMRAMGCELVVPINTAGGIGNFTSDIVRLFGGSEEDVDDLFSLDDLSSAWLVALEEQDATVCANWDSLSPAAIPELNRDGYFAPFLSDDPNLLSLDADIGDREIEGCTIVTPGDTLVAQVGRFPGYTGPLNVGGTVTTNHNFDDTFITLSQDLLLMLDLNDVESSCINCDVRIHRGFICDEESLVLDHFWEPDTGPGAVPDPWNIPPNITFGSTADGNPTTSFPIDAGTSYGENVGRAVVVHAQDGTRIGCGLLTSPSEPSPPLVTQETVDGVNSTVLLENFTLTISAEDLNRVALTAVIGDYLFSRLVTEFSNLTHIILLTEEADRRELQDMVTVPFAGRAVFSGLAPDSAEVIAEQRESLLDFPAMQASVDAESEVGTDVVVESGTIEEEPISPTNAPNVAPTNAPIDTADDSSSNTGIIIGVVLGVVAVLAALFGWYFYRKRRKQNQEEIEYPFQNNGANERAPQSEVNPEKEAPGTLSTEIKGEESIEAEERLNASGRPQRQASMGLASRLTPMKRSNDVHMTA